MKTIFINSLIFLSAGLATAQTIDPTFGNAGKVVTMPLSGGEFSLATTKVDSNGDIYTLGTVYYRRTNVSDVVLKKYNSNGTLDASYAEGGTYTLGIHFIDIASDLLLLDQGKVLITGYTRAFGGIQQPFIVRLNATGSMEGGNLLNVSSLPADLQITSVAPTPTKGYILSGMGTSTNQTQDFYALKLDSNFALEDTFGEGGVAAYDFASSHDYCLDALVHGNTLILTGYSATSPREQFAVAAVDLSTGHLKTAFGTQGKVLINPSSVGHDRAIRATLLPHGKLLLNGYAKLSTREVVALASIDAVSGLLDKNFDYDGKRTIYVAGKNDRSSDVALGPNGSIYISGLSQQYNNTYHPILIKIHANGSNDKTFGQGGIFTFVHSVDVTQPVAVSLQNLVHPLISAITSFEKGFLLMRLTPAAAVLARQALEEEHATIQALSVFPSPATDQVTCTIHPDLATALQGSVLKIMNSHGQAVSAPTPIDAMGVQVPLAGLRPGIYSALIISADGKQRAMTQFVVQP